MSISQKPPRIVLRRMLLGIAWLASLMGAFVAGAYVYREKDAIVAWFKASRAGAEVIESNLYSLVLQKIEVPAYGRDGAIDALGDGLLFINRLGDSWFIDKDKRLHPLALKVPINIDEFEADPYNKDTVSRDRFAVKDVLVQSRPAGVRIFASYNFWHSDRDCYVLRVSSFEAATEELRGTNERLNERWRHVFDTDPCRSLTMNPNGRTRNPTLGAGGRLVALDEDRILLSVGGFGPETVTEDSVAPPDEPRSYGSTMLIDVATRTSRNFSFGHRNPQGLAIAPEGTIWLTDHGARGGDELNQIVDGLNYGHPMVSYGTEYESMLWRRNPRQGRHDGFEKPKHVWIPSIGVSQLAVVTRSLFSHWESDLLVTSLRAQSIFRVRIEDGRAIFSEAIRIGRRIRDIAELADGAIVLKTDDNHLVYLRPIDSKTLYRLDLPADARGEVLAASCRSCHAMVPNGEDAIGPNLWGVVGRPIASRQGYDYTPALLGLDGEWTQDSLSEFLSDPQAVAPGSSMVITTQYSEREIQDIVAFLSKLK